MAVYACVPFTDTDPLAGVTARETNCGAVIVSTVEPLTEPRVALMVVLPTLAPVARPPLVMVAAAVLLELHVTEAVRFCVLLSLYVPVAVKAWVRPLATDGFAGVTAIETKVKVTVKPVEPLIEPEVARMVVLPTATPVATPAMVMVAAAVLLELHVTEAVRFWVLVSV